MRCAMWINFESKFHMGLLDVWIFDPWLDVPNIFCGFVEVGEFQFLSDFRTGSESTFLFFFLKKFCHDVPSLVGMNCMSSSISQHPETSPASWWEKTSPSSRPAATSGDFRVSTVLAIAIALSHEKSNVRPNFRIFEPKCHEDLATRNVNFFHQCSLSILSLHRVMTFVFKNFKSLKLSVCLFSWEFSPPFACWYVFVSDFLAPKIYKLTRAKLFNRKQGCLTDPARSCVCIVVCSDLAKTVWFSCSKSHTYATVLLLYAAPYKTGVVGMPRCVLSTLKMPWCVRWVSCLSHRKRPFVLKAIMLVRQLTP